MNAYEFVESLLKKGVCTITENELEKYSDWEIALAILKTKYHARYCEPYDCHCCGSYVFDNPYLKKVPAFILQYCFFDEDKWENLAMFRSTTNNGCADHIGGEIVRLDYDKGKAKSEDIFYEMIKNKVFVGKARLWRIKETEMYE